MDETKACVVCACGLSGRQRQFCSARCKGRVAQSYKNQQSRGLERKCRLVEMNGGKCSRCGYCRNLAALTFHHRVPASKLFQLDLRSLSNRTWQAILAEVAKCDLLCFNCHAELHNPHLDQTTVVSKPFAEKQTHMTAVLRSENPQVS